MQKDYKEPDREFFIVDNGVFINPTIPDYNLLLNLFNDIAKAVKELKNYESRRNDKRAWKIRLQS